MARSYGANATFAGKIEASYGTPPGGNYESLPFTSSSLGSEQGLIASDVLGQGRDPAAPIRDVIRVEGDVVVPVDLRSFAFWLRLLLGEPDTSGAEDPYTHTFRSGEDELPSATVEIGHPKVPAFFLLSGLRANSLSLEFQRSGGASASRRRERVEIKVYLPEDPPDGLCWHKPEKDDPDDCGCNGKSGETELVDPSPDEVCKCLKTCGDCHCCGESWIYLGCVDLTRDVAEPIGQRQRRYIKPIDCLCRKVREEKPKPESEPPATPPKGTRSRNRPRK
jgi:hypothetical protein